MWYRGDGPCGFVLVNTLTCFYLVDELDTTQTYVSFYFFNKKYTKIYLKICAHKADNIQTFTSRLLCSHAQSTDTTKCVDSTKSELNEGSSFLTLNKV